MEKPQSKTGPQSPKIAVTPQAETVLGLALEKVNSGFLGGKVSKLDLASWAIRAALENLTEATVEKIRKRYFNEVCYLEAVLKQTRANGQDKLTPEQIATLQSVLNVKPEKTKKSKEDSDPISSVE